jgi:hypothetical protein
MPRKLIYTSAPRLLQAGRSGLGTVAMSRDIPKEVVKAAESFSQFSRQPGMENTRVVYSYRTVRCGDGIRHVLSCIRDAGADYSGRTNHLAEHLILDDSEARNCATKGYTPAGVLLGTEWPAHDGYCGWIDTPVLWGSADPAPTWEWWEHHSGSRECRHNLCTQSALRGAVFAYGKGLERQTDEEARQVLCLFSESQQECADKGWGVTFTTNVEPNDEFSDFRWIGVPENSPMLSKLQSSTAREWITLGTPPPARPVAAPAQTRGSHAAAKGGGHLASRGAGASQATTAGKAVSGVIEPPSLRSGKTAASPDPSFAKLHGKKLVYAGIALILLAAVVPLLWAMLTPPDVEFHPASLKRTYNGEEHAAVLVKSPSKAVVGYAKLGSGSWSQVPPKDVGSYALRLEIPGWWRTKVIPRDDEVLVIEKRKPIVRFPDKLEFVEDGTPHEVKPEIVDIPPGEVVRSEVQYKHKELDEEWTTSPRRNRGEYSVKVTTVESDNLEGVTAATTFRIIKEGGDPSSGALVTPPETPKPDAAIGGLEDGASSSERVVLVPERDSLKLLPEIADLPAANTIQVQFRNASRRTEWEELGFRWSPKDGLPTKKPSEFLDALQYQVSDGDQPVLRVLELVDGAGASIQELFQTGPFFLERAAAGANSVSLGPQEFFGDSLEVLPTNAYFEVSFETKLYSLPTLEFRKGEAGWEAEIPLRQIEDEVDAMQQNLQTLTGKSSEGAGVEYYQLLVKAITSNAARQSHESANQLETLKAAPGRFGKTPNEREIVKAVILDVLRVVERFVSLSDKAKEIREKAKKPEPGDKALQSVGTSFLTVDELDGRLEAQTSSKDMIRVARDWVSGRHDGISNKKQDQALKQLMHTLAWGFKDNFPPMTTTDRISRERSDAETKLRSLKWASSVLAGLGVTSQRPEGIRGRLAFVYPDNGETVRLNLDNEIRLQPNIPR